MTQTEGNSFKQNVIENVKLKIENFFGSLVKAEKMIQMDDLTQSRINHLLMKWVNEYFSDFIKEAFPQEKMSEWKVDLSGLYRLRVEKLEDFENNYKGIMFAWIGPAIDSKCNFDHLMSEFSSMILESVDETVADILQSTAKIIKPG